MPLYLSVGAKQIQRWLAATPRLRLMRGASLALDQVTSTNVVDAWLHDGGFNSRVSSEGGDVGGVVVLEVNDDPLEGLATALLVHLDDQVSGLHWQGWARTAGSYVEAHRAEMDHVPDPARRAFSSIPTMSEFGLVGSCPGCGAEAADIKGEVDKLLSEEAAKENSAGFPYGRDCSMRLRTHLTRHRHAASWMDALASFGAPAKDFGQLARQGGRTEQADISGAVGRRDSRSHLALVVADGNRLGAMFDALAGGGVALAGLRSKAVGMINDGIRQAVVDAAEAITPTPFTPNICPVEALYVGGDDILVSVPAVFAWRFVHELMRGVERLRKQMLAEVPEGPARDPFGRLSLGVGLVFAHESFPVAQVRDIGEQALRHAKDRSKGRVSAVCYADLSVDGSGRERHVITAEALARDLDPDSTPVLLEPSTSASSRARLTEALRRWREGGDDAEAVLDRLENNLRRLGLEMSPIPAGFDAGQRLQATEELLARSRWWPRPTGDATIGAAT